MKFLGKVSLMLFVGNSKIKDAQEITICQESKSIHQNMVPYKQNNVN